MRIFPIHAQLFKTAEVDDNTRKDDNIGTSHQGSALDKLLGQLGIYATWLSPIASLQKQLRIFIFFYATFFFSA